MAVVIEVPSLNKDIQQFIYECAVVRGATYTVSFPFIKIDFFTFNDNIAGAQVKSLVKSVFPESFF